MNLFFTILGDPRTKKNSSRIVTTKKGRSFLIPSKQYKAYEKSFCQQAQSQCVSGLKIDEKVCIRCVYYMRTHRKVDLTNLLSATMDCLVTAGVIEDDNSKIAAANDGSRVRYDKESPRVEITISSLVD